MTSTYKINEVARRSGFTPATLRYYEDIGLVPAVARTDSGYRQYGDEVIDRLAFIARAKQLGCSLEETADLLVAWDGGECGPIQDRLRVLVASKTEAAEKQIAELTMLRLQLLEAGAALADHRPDGPCDEACGCSVVALLLPRRRRYGSPSNGRHPTWPHGRPDRVHRNRAVRNPGA